MPICQKRCLLNVGSKFVKEPEINIQPLLNLVDQSMLGKCWFCSFFVVVVLFCLLSFLQVYYEEIYLEFYSMGSRRFTPLCPPLPTPPLTRAALFELMLSYVFQTCVYKALS